LLESEVTSPGPREGEFVCPPVCRLSLYNKTPMTAPSFIHRKGRDSVCYTQQLKKKNDNHKLLLIFVDFEPAPCGGGQKNLSSFFPFPLRSWGGTGLRSGLVLLDLSSHLSRTKTRLLESRSSLQPNLARFQVLTLTLPRSQDSGPTGSTGQSAAAPKPIGFPLSCFVPLFFCARSALSCYSSHDPR
jgi:hypothetical protein